MTDLSLTYQLVVSDMDGTLLDSKFRLSAGASEAIQAMRAQGVRFTLASGRGYDLMQPIAERLGLDTPYIASGGAVMVDPRSRAVLWEGAIDVKLASELTELGRRLGFGVGLHEPQRILTEMDDELWELYNRPNWLPDIDGPYTLFTRTRDVLADLRRAPVRVDLFGPRERLAAASAEIRRAYPQVQVLSMLSHIEVTNPGVNKGSAVRRLAGQLGVPAAAVLALGDEVNDLPMFQAAGFAVATGNASSEIRTRAAAIAPTNNDGGFAWAIKRFVLR